jgi:uncharacterized membrane protein YcaP (DUF421 family)
MMPAIDWEGIFQFSVHPAEIFVRGTAIYWFIFLLFRFLLRRDIGAIAVTDVMLLVLIADAASNGMSGNYDSVVDGCLLVATIAGWNYVLNWMSFYSPLARRVLQPPPLALVRDGKIQRRAMRQELITMEELKYKLREQGIQHFDEIRIAYLEENGEISVLRYDHAPPPRPPRTGAPLP